MSLLKNFRTPLIIVIITILVITYRLISPGGFRPDAKKWAEPSFTGSNVVSREAAIALPGTKLVVLLDPAEEDGLKADPSVVMLHPGSVLSKNDIKTIKNHEGPVLLLSTEPALSARTWMVLAQRGMKNLYIINNQNDEILKYKFRPDSIISPEL